MADDDLSPVGDMRRVLVHVPVEVGTLLDLVRTYSMKSKKQTNQDIWAAGMEAVLGITPDEVVEAGISYPPRGAAVPRDLKAIVKLLCGE